MTNDGAPSYISSMEGLAASLRPGGARLSTPDLAALLAREAALPPGGRAAHDPHSPSGLAFVDQKLSARAGLDEGLLSFSLPHSRLYGESI